MSRSDSVDEYSNQKLDCVRTYCIFVSLIHHKGAYNTTSKELCSRFVVQIFLYTDLCVNGLQSAGMRAFKESHDLNSIKYLKIIRKFCSSSVAQEIEWVGQVSVSS